VIVPPVVASAYGWPAAYRYRVAPAPTVASLGKGVVRLWLDFVQSLDAYHARRNPNSGANFAWMRF
jgi:hypothetical protein